MSAGKEQGFTLVGALVLTGLMGLGMLSYSEMASHATHREKEAELLFRGNQYRLAIESYYRKEQRYPQALADLVEDRRFPTPARHLRRLYADPITGEAAWGLVKAPDGGIMGVHSKSEVAPLKSGNFSLADKTFADARKYSDWQFFYNPK